MKYGVKILERENEKREFIMFIQNVFGMKFKFGNGKQITR